MPQGSWILEESSSGQSWDLGRCKCPSTLPRSPVLWEQHNCICVPGKMFLYLLFKHDKDKVATSYSFAFLCLFLSVLTICSFWLDCLIHLYLILLICLNLHLPLILFCINKQIHEYVAFLFLLFILKLAYYRYIPVTFFHVIYILYISTLTASHDFFPLLFWLLPWSLLNDYCF